MRLSPSRVRDDVFLGVDSFGITFTPEPARSAVTWSGLICVSVGKGTETRRICTARAGDVIAGSSSCMSAERYPAAPPRPLRASPAERSTAVPD